MAQFNNVFDFIGSYSGSYDGRSGQVTINVVGQGDPIWIAEVTFTDLDRNETYSGGFALTDTSIHELGPFDLTLAGGGNLIHWSKLLLHTWNTTYMSGISVWNNIEFGMSFTRR